MVKIIEQEEKNMVLKFPKHKLLSQILKGSMENDKNCNINHE